MGGFRVDVVEESKQLHKKMIFFLVFFEEKIIL